MQAQRVVFGHIMTTWPALSNSDSDENVDAILKIRNLIEMLSATNVRRRYINAESCNELFDPDTLVAEV